MPWSFSSLPFSIYRCNRDQFLSVIVDLVHEEAEMVGPRTFVEISFFHSNGTRCVSIAQDHVGYPM